MNKKSLKGFTLIELMIVVAVLGILSAIATPSYVEYVRKGKRADAKIELLRLAQMQESFFVQNLTYAKSLKTETDGSGLGLGTTATIDTEQGEYKIGIAALDSGGGTCTGLPADACTAYTLTATPVSGKSQATDSSCLGFTLNNVGQKGITVTGATTDAIRSCWK